jgi:hypothetical protein
MLDFISSHVHSASYACMDFPGLLGRSKSLKSLHIQVVGCFLPLQAHYVFPDASMQQRCERFIVSTFDSLCEEEGIDAVRDALPPEL